MDETAQIEPLAGVFAGDRVTIDGVPCLVVSMEIAGSDDGVLTYSITTRPVTDAD